MKTYAIKRDDGGVSILHIRDDSDLNKEVKKWEGADRQDGGLKRVAIEVVEVELEDIPDNRDYRNAWNIDENKNLCICPVKAKELHVDIVRKRRRKEYPAMGDQSDANYKNRQKARMWAGKASAALEDGDLATALKYLIEAVQPCDESDNVDSQINQVKQRNRKDEKIKI